MADQARVWLFCGRSGPTLSGVSLTSTRSRGLLLLGERGVYHLLEHGERLGT